MDNSTCDKKTFSGKDFKDVDHFINSEGSYIFCRYWMPDNKPKAMILIVHGYGEHSGRHSILAKKLISLGFLVFSHDHYCHGESEGYHLDLPDYQQCLKDLLQHCNLMTEKHPELPLFVFGHSMGGALAILLVHQNPHLTKNIVLSSPLIAQNPQMTKIKVTLASWVSSLLPRIPGGELDSNHISRLQSEVSRYNEDPLVYHGKVLVRSAYQIYLLANETQKSLPDVKFSFIVIHGDADKLCDVSGSQLMYDKAQSSDKELKIISGGFHELVHDEAEASEQFLSYIQTWLEKRL